MEILSYLTIQISLEGLANKESGLGVSKRGVVFQKNLFVQAAATKKPSSSWRKI